jgi:hypothetical protein
MSTYTPIATQTLGSAAATVTFSSIPQGYTDLVLVVNGLVSSNSAAAWLGFNADTSSLYSSTRISGSGSTAASSRFTGRTNSNNWYGGSAAGLSSTNNNTVILQIQGYSNATTFKTWLSRTAGLATETVVGLYRSTSPITTITLGMESAVTYSTGTTFSLYGIAVGNSSAKADGGSNVTTDGTYWYHTFKSSGAFIPRQALTNVDYLVVAGGGAGGLALGGGGGAGGLRSTVTATGGGGSLESKLSLSKDVAYTVAIGAGAPALPYSAYSQGVKVNGSDSIFSTITSTGGGGGGSSFQDVPSTGGNGGSGGGGAGRNNTAGGNGTSGQGYGGGLAGGQWGAGEVSGGGGGGAGAAGANCAQGSSVNVGGAGGAGVQITALATATGTGANSGYYAGGGGGWGSNGTRSAGGLGGGGGGGTYPSNNSGISGTANTGGGGGGTYPTTVGSTAGSGGSGIVIIRYAV